MFVEWVIAVATLISPFFAVQASQALAKHKEKRDRKLQVFHTLMLTRGHGSLTNEHVRALNLIDIEFHNDKKAKGIISAWRTYQGHLNLPKVTTAADEAVWISSRSDRLAALLAAMAKYFKYDFDEAYIRNPNYMPQLYGDLEADASEARKLTLEVLRGNRAIPFLPILVQPSDGAGGGEELKQRSMPNLPTTDELKRDLDKPKP